MGDPQNPAFPQIPGYRIEKRLGAGAMGQVFLARQESLDRLVALKVLSRPLAQDPASVERFFTEARSAGKLGHENIVAAVDVGEAGGRYYLVMEYVPGKTLAELILKEAPLAERRSLELARQIARGLEHAHSHGFVHRDIKPSNILLTAEGVAKICDLGLARELGSGSGAGEGHLQGTPAYASPEQCRGARDLDARADLYSLGVTLFEMLVGRRPFLGKTGKDLARQQETEEPPSPRTLQGSVSPAAAELVLRLLRKGPEDRYRSASELLEAIENALKNPHPQADRIVTRRVRARSAKPGSLGWLMAGAAGLLLAGLLAVALGGRGSAARTPAPPAAARDPRADRLFEEALLLEQGARGRAPEYSGVRSRWKELEDEFRGTPEHARFTERRLLFEAQLAAEAEALERPLLKETEAGLSGDGILLALVRLREYPEPFRSTPAGVRVAARANEIERALEKKLRASVERALGLQDTGKFEEARSELRGLRSLLFSSNAPSTRELHSTWDPEVQRLIARVDEADLAARRRQAPDPGSPKAPAPPPPPASPPGDASRNAPAARPQAPREPRESPASRLGAFRQALEAQDPAQWEAARALVQTGLTQSPVYRAAEILLARGIPEGPKNDSGRAELLAYLSRPSLDPPEKLAAQGHEVLAGSLAKSLATLQGGGRKLLLPFLLAHLEALLGGGGAVDPALALSAGLRKGALLGLVGPAEEIDRLEVAQLLLRPPAPGIGRSGLRALAAADFPSRFAGALLLLREPAIDVQPTADRWKKLASQAPDSSWAKLAEAVAERLRLSASCEACLGQGKYACPGCAGLGTAPCATCSGSGSVVDDCGGKATCTTCKGRGQILCATCAGAKTSKCGTCEGKKSKSLLPGGLFRSLVDLGRCPACLGTGSAFSGVLYPCPRCGGLGRVMDDVLREFGKLPVWLKGSSGAACFNALRWLALHQAPEGLWGASTWPLSCPAQGCEKESPGGPYDIGVSSLAVLAFLGAGLGPESDVRMGHRFSGDTVRRALRAFLAVQRPEGLIATQGSDKPVLEHLLATQALAQALSASGGAGSGLGEAERNRLREGTKRALQYALDLQLKAGGWGYAGAPAPGDTWVSVWGALALQAAKEAGLEIPRNSQTSLLRWIESVTDRGDLHVGEAPDRMGKVDLEGTESFLPHDTLSAAGGFARLFLEGKPGPAVQAAGKSVLKDLPAQDPAARDYAYWHWGTLFLAQRELRRGAVWTRWTSALLRELLPLQETKDTCALGSWPPQDRWGAHGGAVYATALSAITLEVQSGLRPLPRVR